ncbi:MAG: AbrB/MazE/SpoVT family DNA-binding domain-containing protein [Rhodanobacter sp.]|nr:AbrB/MazE/SpoVT family DNA-binding domain-containing protein [Rhodanobacter sp.]
MNDRGKPRFGPARSSLDLLPDGRAELKAARPSGTIDGFLGLLTGKTRKVVTIEEMSEAAAAGWSGEA